MPMQCDGCPNWPLQNDQKTFCSVWCNTSHCCTDCHSQLNNKSVKGMLILHAEASFNSAERGLRIPWSGQTEHGGWCNATAASVDCQCICALCHGGHRLFDKGDGVSWPLGNCLRMMARCKCHWVDWSWFTSAASWDSCQHGLSGHPFLAPLLRLLATHQQDASNNSHGKGVCGRTIPEPLSFSPHALEGRLMCPCLWRIMPRDLEPNLSQMSHFILVHFKLKILIYKQLKRPVAFSAVHFHIKPQIANDNNNNNNLF